MNNESKKTPTKQIKVDIALRSGGSIRGYLNIRGSDRLTDFMEDKTKDFLPFTRDEIGMKFRCIPKSNIAWIDEV